MHKKNPTRLFGSKTPYNRGGEGKSKSANYILDLSTTYPICYPSTQGIQHAPYSNSLHHFCGDCTKARLNPARTERGCWNYSI